MSSPKFTIKDFAKKKHRGRKITMLTAHDYPTGRMVDLSGVDAVLVGDSLGMVALGYETTREVTMDDMIHHSKAVRKGVERAFLIADMPYMSCEPSDEEALKNAMRFVSEASCDAVKVEGGQEMASRIRAIISGGIPVMGHIGLTPQSVGKDGVFRVKGRDGREAERIKEDALCLEKTGCFAVVLECMPAVLAGQITGSLEIPAIGIGAGPGCDGQVLVTYDVLGLFDKFVPRFVKRYAAIGETANEALRRFRMEVESGEFPDKDRSF